MKISHKGTPTVVGIDMGAFSTKIAAVQRGAIDVITNQANFRETPSVVGFGQGERKIGELGSVKLKSNFKNTVVSPTRYLGLNSEGEHVKVELDNCPCATKLQNETVHFKVSANGIDESFSPEQILASFLTKLQSIIEHNQLDDKLIMFSVPSYFTQIERKALLNAAQIAGLNNVKLVSEAVAIALDYGGFKKSQMGQGKNVVFVDFGHSKLSVSAVKFNDAKMEVIYQKADRNIGCRDIDRKIFEYMSAKFQEKTSLNIKQSKRACLKLLQAIQKQRKILSGITQTDISVQSLFEDEDFSQAFTRQTLINSAIEVFEQITKLLQDFKSQVQKLGVKIDSVELVGGGSRIPKFIEIAQQVFGMSVSRTTNSSQTIARGATLAAVQQSAIFRFDTLAITNRSLLGINLTSDGQEVKQVVLATNQIIPAEKVIRIPQQSQKQLILTYEGTSPQFQSRILRIQRELIEKKSQQKTEDKLQQKTEDKPQQIKDESTQQKKQLTITIKISQQGIITVSSITDSQNKPIKFHVHPYHQLTSQQISAYKAKQKQMFTKDFHTVRSYQKKNQLEAFIYKQREAVNKEQFKKYVTADQMKKLQEYFNQITESLADQESNKWSIKDYEKKKSQVDKQIKELDQIVKKRKQTLVFHFKQLQNLKAQAASTIAQIQQRYRTSKPVVQTCEGIKQIENWADQTLKESKTKNISELPLVTKQDIEQQHQNIKTLVNQLLNPQRPKQPQQAPKQQQQPSRHERYEQQYDPQQRYRQQQRQQQQRQQQQRQQQQQRRQPQYYYQPEDPMSYSGYRRPQQQYYEQPQYYMPPQSQQQQRRKQQQQQQYDPFGMSRSGFFGPGSGFFGNSSGFW